MLCFRFHGLLLARIGVNQRKCSFSNLFIADILNRMTLGLNILIGHTYSAFHDIGHSVGVHLPFALNHIDVFVLPLRKNRIQYVSVASFPACS